MSNLNKLFDLTDALNESGSNEGCEADLMVVSSARLLDLTQYVRLLKAVEQSQNVEDHANANKICERLLNSEEHSVESAIPGVAEDAVEVINRLSIAMKATQVALSQAMQHSEERARFVKQIADLSIWDFEKDDGTPYKECERPSDGFLDSHCCLMASIDEARRIDLRAALEASNSPQGEDSEDWTGRVEMSVTADSPEEAAKFTLDDIRDRELEGINVDVQNVGSGRIVTVFVKNA